MLTRIRIRPLLRLARRDLPAPVDVVNLIRTARFDRYRWYALLVAAPLAAVGARVRWMGRLERCVHGGPQADKLLIVRYPSHRRFLAMTLNPYYLAINRLREAGVRRFEASFTHASHPGSPSLARREVLVGVHFGDEVALDDVRAAAEPVCGELAYATRAVASLDFLAPPRPADPAPLAFPQLALFAPPQDAALDGGLDAAAARLAALGGGCAVAVYHREPRRTYRPSLRSAA